MHRKGIPCSRVQTWQQKLFDATRQGLCTQPICQLWFLVRSSNKCINAVVVQRCSHSSGLCDSRGQGWGVLADAGCNCGGRRRHHGSAGRALSHTERLCLPLLLLHSTEAQALADGLDWGCLSQLNLVQQPHRRRRRKQGGVVSRDLLRGEVHQRPD